MKEFPIISDQFRVSWQVSRAKVLNKKNGAIKELGFFDAILLSMCNGSFSMHEIRNVFSKYYSDGANIDEVFSHIEPYLDYAYKRSSLKDPEGIIKLLKHGNPIVGYRKDAFPSNVVINLTTKCNLECVYCIRDESGEKEQSRLTSQAVWKILRELANNQVLRVVFTGGEPLLDRNIFDYIFFCVDYDIYPFLSTNGELLTESRVNKLLEAGLQKIQVSLDTLNQDRFYAISKCKSLEKILSNIENAISTGLSVSLRMVLIEENESDVESLVDYANSIGVCNINITPAITFNSAQHRYRPLSSLSEQQIIDNFTSNPIQNVSYKNVNSSWQGVEDIVRCGGVESDAIIFSNGDIGFCANLPSYTYGNIRNTTIEDAWNSIKFDELIGKFTIDNCGSSICATCSEFNSCRAGCPAVKLGQGKAFNDIDPRCFKNPEVKHERSKNK